jgi:hypothetical protein
VKSSTQAFYNSGSRTSKYILAIKKFSSALEEQVKMEDSLMFFKPKGIVHYPVQLQSTELTVWSPKQRFIDLPVGEKITPTFRQVSELTKLEYQQERQALCNFICGYVFGVENGKINLGSELITHLDVAISFYPEPFTKQELCLALKTNGIIKSPNFFIDVSDAHKKRSLVYFSEAYLLDKTNHHRIISKGLINENTPISNTFKLQTRQKHADGWLEYGYGDSHPLLTELRGIDAKTGQPDLHYGTSTMVPVIINESTNLFDGILNDPLQFNKYAGSRISQYKNIRKLSGNKHIEAETDKVIEVLKSNQFTLLDKIALMNATDVCILNLIKSKRLPLYYNPMNIIVWGTSLQETPLYKKNPFLHEEYALTGFSNRHYAYAKVLTMDNESKQQAAYLAKNLKGTIFELPKILTNVLTQK